jgi:hypothetical protein
VPAVVRAHPDPLVNRILVQKRDAELLQAFGRIRPIHATEPKRVFLLTSGPIPWVSIDYLVKLDELLPDARASRGPLAGKGVLPLAPAALVKLLPDEWPTENAAKSWVRYTLKGRIPGKNILSRDPTLYQLIRYRLAQQPGRPAEALTWLSDEAAVQKALEAIHGRPVTYLEIPDPSPTTSNPTGVTP